MKRFISILFIGIALPFVLSAQGDKKTLEIRKQKVDKEIKELDIVYKETVNTKQQTEIQQFILQKKIEIRGRLIRNVKSQIVLVNQEIKAQENIIEALEDDLETLKKEYKKMLIFAYKHRNETENAMFVLASDDFNKAYKRSKYLQDMVKYRKRQARLIKLTQKIIEKEKVRLQNTIGQKKELLTEEESNRQQLDQEKKKVQEVYVSLKQRQNELKRKRAKKEKEKRDLKNAIDKLIAAEIAAAKDKGGVLSSNFASNQRKLPWPVEGSVTVSQKFGKNVHTVLDDKVVVINNGIDILIKKGSKARAVFKGEVSAVIKVPSGDYYAVLVKHGKYFTLYSNLSKATVKKGEKVDTKQELGTIKTDAEDGKTVLHFELWNGSTKQNPQLWLTPR